MPIFSENCSKCGVKDRYYPKFKKKPDPCDECGGKVERLISGATFHDFNRIMGTSDAQPYTTCNIRSDGKPVTVTSHEQLQRVCRENNVVHTPGKNPM